MFAMTDRNGLVHLRKNTQDLSTSDPTQPPSNQVLVSLCFFIPETLETLRHSYTPEGYFGTSSMDFPWLEKNKTSTVISVDEFAEHLYNLGLGQCKKLYLGQDRYKGQALDRLIENSACFFAPQSLEPVEDEDYHCHMSICYAVPNRHRLQLLEAFAPENPKVFWHRVPQFGRFYDDWKHHTVTPPSSEMLARIVGERL